MPRSRYSSAAMTPTFPGPTSARPRSTHRTSPNTFGLLFTLPVDDVIFAQPLYVPNVAIADQGTHNVIYVATMSDTLYAFDADTGGERSGRSTCDQRRRDAGKVRQLRLCGAKNNIVGNMGILSTPVIDPSTNVMYLVACTLENNTHGLSAACGGHHQRQRAHAPGVLISGSYRGVTFDPALPTQRRRWRWPATRWCSDSRAIEAE